MCNPTAFVALAGSLFSTEMQASAASDASDKAQRAQEQNAQIAKDQLTAQQEATNRANAKSPDVSGILAANAATGKAGASSTLLTGPQGVDPTKLNLGKSVLLGG